MIDVSLLAPAFGSAKAALGLVKGATAAAVDHGVKDKLIEIQSAILDIQEKLGDAQAERLDLLHQLDELKRKVRDFEDAKAALDKYELFEIKPGKFVYRSKAHEGTEPAHYICPKCYSEGRATLLQAGTSVHGGALLRCSACSFSLTTVPVPPPKRGMITSSSIRP